MKYLLIVLVITLSGCRNTEKIPNEFREPQIPPNVYRVCYPYASSFGEQCSSRESIHEAVADCAAIRNKGEKCWIEKDCIAGDRVSIIKTPDCWWWRL